jgi:glutamate carboxypeptidase
VSAETWIPSAAGTIAARAERELEALVAVSSPSGDRHGAEEALAVCAALLPDAAQVQRIDCSSPDHAPDLLARLSGEGTARVLLLGHVDTVIAHSEHRPLRREGECLGGSGAVDMKGGVVLALGVLRHLAAHDRDRFAEATLLLVCDEEWRTAPFAHADRFAGFDACLCFEAGQRGPAGAEGVVVRRKAAGTLRVTAAGASAHSGSAPEKGRNALLALARTAEIVAGLADPGGLDRLTAVPTVMHSGDAFNVVPADGELFCDLRADTTGAFDRVLAALPAQVGGAELRAELVRVWPGMDSREATAPVLERASHLLGREVAGMERGGASDASHVASVVAVTIDGLGPRGGGAHSPTEHVLARTLLERSEVALAVTAAALQPR